MIRLWLIRHLPPDVEKGICYGQTDLPLETPLSEQRAILTELRRQLPDDTPVFSSPLRRCAEMALVLNHSVVQDERLKELNFGDWEMQPWDVIGPRALDDWAADLAGFRPPNGETGFEVQQRALSWLREITRQHDSAIIVTHAGVMRALQAHQEGLPGAKWLTLRYDYGQVIRLEFTAEQINAAPVQ